MDVLFPPFFVEIMISSHDDACHEGEIPTETCDLVIIESRSQSSGAAFFSSWPPFIMEHPVIRPSHDAPFGMKGKHELMLI